MRQLLALALILTFLLTSVNLTRAACTGTVDECQAQIDQQKSQLTTIQQQQDDLQKQLDAAQKNLSATTAQLNDLQKKVDDIHTQLVKAEDDLKNAQGVLDQNKSLFRVRVRDFYIHGSISGWELLFGNSYSFADAAQFAGLKQAVIDRNKSLIIQYTSTVKNLDETRAQIAGNEQTAQAQLSQIATIRNRLAYQASSIKSKLAYNAQQSALLGSSIDQLNSQLSQLQAAALAAKQAGNGKAGSGGAGSYRFYGYGTEHGVGMSQWGGFQLAHQQGKTSTQILQFYYAGVSVQGYGGTNQGNYDDNTWKITVDGYGQMTYAQYLAGIGETDPNWYNIDSNAAAIMDQVQVIAARTYALSYTGGDPNHSICITEACQVYVGGTGKAAAASATRNQVVTSGGALKTTYYFSTSGPHTDCIGDSPSFVFNGSNRSYGIYGCSGSGVYQRADFSDSMSPYNNWSGIIPNSWSGGIGTPPDSSYTGGTPLTNSDLEVIINASLLSASGTHLGQVSSGTSLDQIKHWLTDEGTTPINDVNSIGLIRMKDIGGTSSDRVAWVTATGSNRSVVSGQITGIRFKYIYNILSPEKDWLYSTWFYVK